MPSNCHRKWNLFNTSKPLLIQLKTKKPQTSFCFLKIVNSCLFHAETEPKYSTWWLVVVPFRCHPVWVIRGKGVKSPEKGSSGWWCHQPAPTDDSNNSQDGSVGQGSTGENPRTTARVWCPLPRVPTPHRIQIKTQTVGGVCSVFSSARFNYMIEAIKEGNTTTEPGNMAVPVKHGGHLEWSRVEN